MNSTPKIDATSISVIKNDKTVTPNKTGEIEKITTPMTHTQKYLGDYESVLSTEEKVYLHNTKDNHEPVHLVGSIKANAIIWKQAHKYGETLRNADLKNINELLIAYAIMENQPRKVNNYVAQIDGGIEIDLGNEANTRIRVTKNGVEL